MELTTGRRNGKKADKMPEGDAELSGKGQAVALY